MCVCVCRYMQLYAHIYICASIYRRELLLLLLACLCSRSVQLCASSSSRVIIFNNVPRYMCPSFSILNIYTYKYKMNVMNEYMYKYIFHYRSATYYQATGVCELSEMDRITLAGSSSFQLYDGKISSILFIYDFSF